MTEKQDQALKAFRKILDEYIGKCNSLEGLLGTLEIVQSLIKKAILDKID